MIYIGSLKVDEELASRTRTVLQSRGGVEAAISFLREQGETKIGTIRMLVVTAGLSLREAKRIVHQSSIWQDRHADDEALHESLADAAEHIQSAEGELVVSCPLQSATR